MESRNIKDVDEKYSLNLDKIIERIKKNKAKLVLLQFPDGLKPYATAIVDYLRKNTSSEFLIWFETCFGACDTSIVEQELEKKIDLLIQFGHNELMPSY